MAPVAAAGGTPGPSNPAAFETALKLVESGPQPAADAARRALASHPLAGYLAYAALRRRLASATPAEFHAFLQQYGDLPVAADLRRSWLSIQAKRGNWAQFRTDYAGDEDPAMHCHSLMARAQLGINDGLLKAMAGAWRHGHSMPDACDPVFATLKAQGWLDTDLRLERIGLAAEEGNTGLMRFLARALPGSVGGKIKAYAAYLDKPGPAAVQWPALPMARAVAQLGLTRLARRDPGHAEALLPRIAQAMKFSRQERGLVLREIALWSAVSYLPEAARRLDAVPIESWNDQLHAWAVREALNRNDLAGALKRIRAMPPTLGAETRWRYMAAHLLDRLGRKAEADAALAELATRPDIYGFLAADRLDQPYTICPLPTPDDAADRVRVAAIPGVQRALLLYGIDRLSWARREWAQALRALPDQDRRVAVRIADDAGWHDRAVFYLSNGDDLRYYELRFPMAHDAHLRAEAGRRGLDPAWVAALIRSESAWMPDARSAANARGLMQLLPVVGRRVAKQLGVTWSGSDTLYQPETNIVLGTEHLKSELDAFQQQPMVATAAYNAGPTPALRWRSERRIDDPALWIETIPYYETRDYVARVFAFSVIYDWRLNGDVLPVTARLLGKPAARKAVICAAAAGGDATALTESNPQGATP
ncbi:MAG: transglycosylase SLT domain-containing protein [Xanthomonadales bacterium]|nr:transglycosylase SLT domain-containing protein [Xanthomonadales bacterium]